MGVKGQEPTPEQMQELRDAVEQQKSEFDPRDVGRVMHEDWYVKRWFMHVWDEPGEQIETAKNMLINCLKWRKESGMRDITPDSINEATLDKGLVFLAGPDKDGKKIIVLHAKKLIKSKENMDEVKRLFLYWVERADRETHGDKISFMMDLKDAGLKNLDMDFMQFTINTFKNYVPYNLNFIFIYEMPWVLNAAYKIIKSWLPAEGVRIIKFLTKSNINEYVADDVKLPQWGGTMSWEYEFEPEGPNNYPEYHGNPKAGVAPINNLEADSDSNEEGKRKVHFDVKMQAAAGAAVAMESYSKAAARTESMNSQRPSREGPNLLSLSPSEEIFFKQTKDGDFFAEIQVANVAPRPVCFKIKTTSPEKYRVRPSMANLGPKGSAVIEIHVQAKLVGSASSLVRDKFLISALSVDQEGLNNNQIADAMKNAKAEAQYRLRCTLASSEQAVSAVIVNALGSSAPSPATPALGGAGPSSGAAAPPAQKTAKQIDTMSKKMTELVESNEELKESLGRLQLCVYGLLGFSLLLFITVLWRTSGTCAPAPVADAAAHAHYEEFEGVHDEHLGHHEEF